MTKNPSQQTQGQSNWIRGAKDEGWEGAHGAEPELAAVKNRMIREITE
jgi:hypothetical protein